jgi:hypothetical protein
MTTQFFTKTLQQMFPLDCGYSDRDFHENLHDTKGQEGEPCSPSCLKDYFNNIIFFTFEKLSVFN